MVKTKELKPPADIVEAIQNSEDGSTAPPEAEVLRGVGATRDIGNKLTHEEPQKPSELPEELKPSHPGRAMDSDEKKFAFEEMQAQQQQEQNYNRNHPGVGKAGKGDQATSSAINKSGNARKQQGARDQAGPTRG
ncbi:hypothetical protein OEZ85_001957 [Tetradesmus obliquus]|uniref:SMP domain-containing protein n=1 Tax=Tetradesmus obliquus TaxID=3088 RepID=A0ABY8U5L8_TETOB|nr:hypothetical protein OEZ85_001957 [Tetradesmus obliquus]